MPIIAMQRAAMAATALIVAMTTGVAEAAERRFVIVGTGAVTGVYYPTGGAICRLVNKGRKEHDIRCSVESTDGSVYNINAIRGGNLDMAVSQSDVQYKAFKGEGDFAESGPYEQLRALFSVHSESFTVVARADAGIKRFDDLKGKRVNIGNPGSGQRSTMEALMAAKGWTRDDFLLATELKPTEQSQAMCDNKVDAIVYTVGHPNGSIQEATTACESLLVAVTGPEVERLAEETPYFSLATIPGGMYRGAPEAVPTFGVKATVVTSTALESDVAYQVVRAVFENFEEFKGLHPAFASLRREDMIRAGNSAPTHEGAVKYFREAGLWH
jgi:hypothetical protein